MADSNNKRRSQFQGTPDTPFETDSRFESGTNPDDAPQKATAAQLAKRKIKGVSSLKARRPGISSGLSHTPQPNPFANSTPAPSITPSISFPPAGNAPATNPFAASANSSFPAFTPPTAQSFNFSAGASNPFANPASAVNGTSSSGFSGSVFNMPPAQPQQTNPFASQANNTNPQTPQAQANSSSIFAQPQANNNSVFGQAQPNNSNGLSFQTQPTGSTTPKQPPPVNFFGNSNSTISFGKTPSTVQSQQSDDSMQISPDARNHKQPSTASPTLTMPGAPALSPAAAPTLGFFSAAQPASEQKPGPETAQPTTSVAAPTTTSAGTMPQASTPFASAGGLFNFSKQTPNATANPAQLAPNPFASASISSQSTNAIGGVFGGHTSNQSGIFSPSTAQNPASTLFGQSSAPPAQNQPSTPFGQGLGASATNQPSNPFTQSSVPASTKAQFSIFPPPSGTSSTSQASNMFGQSPGAPTSNQPSGAFGLPAATTAPDHGSEKTATATAPAQASTFPTLNQTGGAFGLSAAPIGNTPSQPAANQFASPANTFGGSTQLSGSSQSKSDQLSQQPESSQSAQTTQPAANQFAASANTFGGSTQPSGSSQSKSDLVSQQLEAPPSAQTPQPSSSGFQGPPRVKPALGNMAEFNPGPPPAHLDQWQKDMWRCTTELAAMNEAFKMKINNAPTAADWTRLSAWHFARSTKLSKKIDSIKKDRAAAMGITGRESNLSTKRKATEQPAPTHQSAETPSKKQRAAETSPGSNTASIFGNVLAKSTVSPPKNEADQRAAPKSSDSTTAASSTSTGSSGAGFSFLGAASTTATPPKTTFGSSAALATTKDSSSSGNDLAYPDLTSSMANQQQSTSVFGSSNTNQSKPQSSFGSLNANKPQSTSAFGSSSANHPQSASVFGSSNTNQPPPTSVFGTSNTAQPQPTSIFGTLNTTQPQPASVFGASNTNQPKSSSAFGSSNANQPKPTFGAPAAASTPAKDTTLSQASSFGGGAAFAFGNATSTNATPSKSMFGAQATPAPAKDTSSSQMFGFTPSKPSAPSQVSGFKPSKPVASSGGFASQFASQSQKSVRDFAKERMEEKKEEDWDEDEETEAEWEARYYKEEEKRLAEGQESMKDAAAFKPTFKPTSTNGSDVSSGTSDAGSSSISATSSNAAQDSSNSLFVPQITVESADGSGSGATSNGLVPSRTQSPGSVFDGPPPPPASSHNIFGHLSSAEQSGDQEDSEPEVAEDEGPEETTQGTANGSQTDTGNENSFKSYKRSFADTDSEDETLEETMRRKREKPSDATPESGGAASAAPKRSLFDRITYDKKEPGENTSATDKPSDTPETPAKSDLFGFKNVKTPSFNFGGATTPTFTFGGSTTPDFKGDQTWKPDSPIKFGASTGPGTGNTEALSVKPQSNLFGNLAATSVAAGPFAPFSFSANTTAAPTPETSRAQTPTTADERTDTAEEAQDPQVSMYSDLTSEERAQFEVLYHVEKAHAKEYEAANPTQAPQLKTWRSKAQGPLWILKDKTSGKALVRVRILPSGSMPVNYFVPPKIQAQLKGKGVLTPYAVEGRMGTYFIAFGDKERAAEFADVFNGNLPATS